MMRALTVLTGGVLLSLISKFRVIQQLERFRFFTSGYMNRQGIK